jgi:hypothetical protein
MHASLGPRKNNLYADVGSQRVFARGRSENGCHDLIEELGHLPLRSTRELLWGENIVDRDIRERGVSRQSLEQIIRQSLLFDTQRSGLAMDPNDFVQMLTISSSRHPSHEQRLRRHERVFFL